LSPMKYETYTDVTFDPDYTIFDFISTGKNGYINKRVAFTPTEMSGVYNLAFGDLDEYGDINDYSVSNNGDRNKVLATVVDIVKLYTEKFPERWIFFRGSSEERTRLYRMAVTFNLEELSATFSIYTVVQGELVSFEKNRPVAAFFVKRKKA
jgi:hypothetical protein